MIDGKEASMLAFIVDETRIDMKLGQLVSHLIHR